MSGGSNGVTAIRRVGVKAETDETVSRQNCPGAGSAGKTRHYAARVHLQSPSASRATTGGAPK